MSTPVRRIPGPRRPTNLARPGRIYVILTRPVDQQGQVLPGPPKVGYIGQTRQQVWQRADQHLAEQPFGDLIVDVLLLDQGTWTDAQLDDREGMWIRAGVSVGGRPVQRPRYNYLCNLENPDRIEIFRAVQHRQHREPGWQPPPKGARIPTQRRAASTVRPRRVSPLSRWWGRHRWQVVLWASVWVLLFAGAWWAGADTWSGWAETRNAAVAATVATAAIGWRRWKLAGTRRRRSKRRGRRR
ncbi:GIY-YIG nuclease family protein [Micromonospora carbonacea]|uniref:hypothetical protein n=1 Tax=Micromonospora carbonacea TaxID=47853 RepID=UPI0037191B84